MLKLIITFCLAGSPAGVCTGQRDWVAPVQPPSLMACQMGQPTIVALATDWLAMHPGYEMDRYACVVAAPERGA